jgi:hypothetical protein
MSFPANLKPAVAYIRENFRYGDGREPSDRTILKLRRHQLAEAIVQFGHVEFIDTDKFAEICRRKVEVKDDPRRRGRPTKSAVPTAS